MDGFDEYRFRSKVDKALGNVKRILDNSREPRYAADVNHTYDDKYGLAEFLTNAGAAAVLNVLEGLGLTEKQLKKLISWAESRAVSLRLSGEEKCAFDREETRKVESATEYVTETKSSFFGSSKRTEKVVTKVTEYFWKFDSQWELSAYKGNDPSEKIVLQSRASKYEIVTTVKTSPKPEVYVVPAKDCNVTWLLQQIDASSLVFKFAIDRKKKSCHTPRRNGDIESALSHFSSFKSWCNNVSSYFMSSLFPVQTNHALNLGSINADSLFLPIQPLFEEKSNSVKLSKNADSKAGLVALPETSQALVAVSGGVSSVLPVGDLNTFLWEQKRSFSEKFGELSKAFPAGDSKEAKLISAAEAIVVALCKHASDLCDHYADGVGYIEKMLYDQLIAAIGKEVTPIDFTAYMRFHNRKLFRSMYEPKPFCHAVRRPEHFPEGTISIEAKQHDGTMAEPILTNMRVLTPETGAVPMRFPINAATNITFGGNRYLHAWVSHQFAGTSGQSLSLIARARQFSSFILVVGRIASAEVFDPKAAMIIKDKDDLTIPLMLETIPAAKEFKERINSMSPEQQRFCKAYRSMQLESTLFGLVVIQIKPQIERLLNLSNDSLTKEIRLTQDLMELFIKYQVPSDLLSFDPRESPHASASERVSTVKRHVKAMQDMVAEKQKDEIKQVAQEAVYSYLESGEISYASDSSQSEDDNDDDDYGYIDEECEEEAGDMDYSIQRSAQTTSSSLRKQSTPAPALNRLAAPPKPIQKESRARSSTAAPAPAAPAPKPAVQPSKPIDAQQQAELKAQQDNDATEVEEVAVVQAVDFTKIPTELDARMEQLDEDAALRPTIINVGPTWTKKQQVALLADPTTIVLSEEEQKQEKNRAFDLLDALSRSGSLDIEQAELHVVVAATHCFDKSIIETIIKQNVNPIEKVERSALIVASTIQDKETSELVKHDQLERVKMFSPMLFPAITGDSQAAIAN